MSDMSLSYSFLELSYFQFTPKHVSLSATLTCGITHMLMIQECYRLASPACSSSSTPLHTKTVELIKSMTIWMFINKFKLRDYNIEVLTTVSSYKLKFVHLLSDKFSRGLNMVCSFVFLFRKV